MVYGIGTDLIQVSRIAQALQRHGERFAKRILHPGEWQQYLSASDQANFVAKRFAAKEAASKALGTGIGSGVSFQDFQICYQPGGRPYLQIEGQAKRLMENESVSSAHLSLSDEADQVIAFVILE